MNNKCMYLDGYSCEKYHEYECHCFVNSNWHNRALCDEHADAYMKANIRSGYPVFAVNLKKEYK